MTPGSVTRCGRTWWAAWSTYFRDNTGLELSGDLWERSRAFEQTIANAGLWWPHTDFVIVCDRPTEIHREQVNPTGWGSHRLHNERGPAISWRDGWALYYVHGVRVTEQIVMHPETLTVQDILGQDNAEVRRVAAEMFGWDRFVAEADLTLINECDDPANQPYKLRLYDLPEQIYEQPVRLVLCTNATPERDGTRRQYGLTVPAETKDALSAIAWTFGVDAKQYAQLASAT